MHDPDRDRPGPLALSILAAATVAEICSNADETVALVRAIQKPLPILPLDQSKCVEVLATALLEKDAAANRLLAMVASGM